MIDFFKKCNKKYFYKDPVEHIIWVHPRTVKEYDDLYEEQNRFDGELWSEFKNTHKIKCKFIEDIRDIDMSAEVICLWFFKERSDRDAGNDIKIAGKTIPFTANKLVLTPSKDIKIQERKKFFVRRPCLQMYWSMEVYVNIKKGLDVNE